MNDNQVLIAVIAALRAGLNSFGLSQVRIKQSFQPRQTGVEIDPTVYLHKIAVDRWGWVGRKDQFSTVLDNPNYPAFGFSNVVGPDPGNPITNFDHGNFATGNDQFLHNDVFYRAATFQVNALATQDPRKIDQLTASDLIESAADVLQSEDTIRALIASRIRMEHITAVREIYFLDDRERHEQNPSFDFTVTYMITRSSIVPPVVGQGCTLHRI